MEISKEEARQELIRRGVLSAEGDEISRPSQPAPENLLQKVMRYGIADPTIGILKGREKMLNFPHRLLPGVIPELTRSGVDYGAAWGIPESEASGVDKMIQLGGQYAPSMAIHGMALGKLGQLLSKVPYAGGIVTRALSEAIPQAAYSAIQAQEEPGSAATETAAATLPFAAISEGLQSTNPVVRNLMRGILMAGGAYAGHEIPHELGMGEVLSGAGGMLGAMLGGRGFRTQKEMKRAFTEGVSREVAEPRLQAAERLGLDYLTPAEAGLSPWASRMQGRLGRTEEGGKLLYEKGLERISSERDAINKTLDLIYDEEKMGPQIKGIYETVYPSVVPEQVIESLGDNHLIKKAQSILSSKPAYKEALKEVPQNSLGYWDHVKQALYDLEEKAPDKEARIISQTRRNLVSQLDNIHPQYQEARHLYERQKVRDALEAVFDRKEITGKNFYQALASDNKFNKMIKKLHDVPEAVDNLKDMRMIFKDLLGPPTIATAKGGEERGMFQMRNLGAHLENLMEHIFTRGKTDEEAIRFITSKDWHKQLQDINKIGNKQMKILALSVLLGRFGAQTLPRELEG